jgi:hypothetical protein
MSSETSSGTGTGRTRHRRPWLNGYTVFAVAIMFVLALWQVLAGIAAVVRDSLYVAPPAYVYGFDIAVWGWVLIVLGVFLSGAAVVVLLGRDGGDTAAIWLACLSLAANFLVLPFYPIWSAAIIGLCGTLLWALMTRGRMQS